MEDLWPFNEECVARAIFNSKIPIVSAVGHEIDFTIADFVSDLRAPTPSAAAEMVFPSKEAFLENLLHYKKTLKYMLTAQMEQYQKQLQYLLSRPVYAARHQYFENQSLEILNLVQKLESSFTMCVRQKRQQFETKVDQLEALSPLHTLKRGYALATKKDQQVLKSIEQVELGDDLEIRLSDGKLHVKVNAKGGL
jgi:exodeoxyribonuclease VII large subunit